MTYHPWRDARDRLPHVDIVLVHHLPRGTRGHACGNRIEISARSISDERRSTLSHEIGHVERGCLVPADPVLYAREEATVERIAARRLVNVDDLVDALRWSRYTPEVAHELWVDIPMLEAFIASLTPAERARIDHELDGIEWVP